MTADVTPDQDEVRLSRRTHLRRGLLLLGLAVFQFWLWGTRIWNLVQDAGSFSTGFVTVHAVLYAAAIGAGVVLTVLGARMLGEARSVARR